MLQEKFVWVSIRHLQWLSYINDNPMVLDDPLLSQMEGKGLIKRNESGFWAPTTLGAFYVGIAKEFKRKKSEKSLSSDELAQLSHSLQTKLKEKIASDDKPTNDEGVVSLFANAS